MKKKLSEEQFALLQGTIAEAENIIQDAVAKLDDPLHIRCTSSPGLTAAKPTCLTLRAAKSVNISTNLILTYSTACIKTFDSVFVSPTHRLPHKSSGGHVELHRQNEKGTWRLSAQHGG